MDNYRLVPTIRTTAQGNAPVPIARPRKQSRKAIKLSAVELESFLRYAVPESELDPHRKMGYFDSWAGNVKQK